MLGSVIGTAMTLGSFLLCVGTALILGIATSLIFSAGGRYTSSWKLSIALLPAVVCVVIMLVSGNIGAGLAVAGTFALVRFRSQPGSAKEVTGLFFAVSLGLMCGMGYVVLAAVFFAVMGAVVLILTRIHFGERDASVRALKIVIPENLDYDGVFADLFASYCTRCELVRVRTTNMGTLYELSYEVTLKNPDQTKVFLDELRCRNGNLNITYGREQDSGLM